MLERPHSTQAGFVKALIIGLSASVAFGVSGAFIKPLLENGWSPTAAVAMRTVVAGLVLAPFAIVALHGKWNTLWRARWRIVGMALVGVAGTQLAYFIAVQRIPVGTAILIEYLAPILLVLFAWATTRVVPKKVVLIGAAVAIGGLVLVVGPGSISGDPVGVFAAFLAAIGAASYYLIAARPSEGLPPVALAATGLLLGSAVLATLGALRVLPFTAAFIEVPFLAGTAPWWVPLGIVAVIGTAIAYAASIMATGMLGSRLMSFIGLLEVVFAALFAWLLLGEALGVVQLLGGVLILAGIAFVHSERPAPIEVVTVVPDDEVDVRAVVGDVVNSSHGQLLGDTDREPAASTPV
ncbi:EamA family transporter [Salinibacterium sp.]|uniref:EamA family transporter n=1 Tax=Salinibacterium sp. TaxID=1915057 RepID=UPI00286D1D98|nr:EamA family transporter [Salinibacterium sp.]